MKSTTWSTSGRAVRTVTRSPLALDRLAGIRSVPSGMRLTGGEVCPQPTALLPGAGISVPSTRIRTTSVYRSAPGRAPGGPPA